MTASLPTSPRHALPPRQSGPPRNRE
jgi:hypothetical protein